MKAKFINAIHEIVKRFNEFLTEQYCILRSASKISGQLIIGVTMFKKSLALETMIYEKFM